MEADARRSCLIALGFVFLVGPNDLAQITVGAVSGVIRDDQKLPGKLMAAAPAPFRPRHGCGVAHRIAPPACPRALAQGGSGEAGKADTSARKCRHCGEFENAERPTSSNPTNLSTSSARDRIPRRLGARPGPQGSDESDYQTRAPRRGAWNPSDGGKI